MVGRSCGRMTQDSHAEVLHTITSPAPPPTGGVESEQEKFSERVSSLDSGNGFRALPSNVVR
jgi:hypothetical protein